MQKLLASYCCAVWILLTITGSPLGKGNVGDYVCRSNRKFQILTQKNYLTQFFFIHFVHLVFIGITTDIVYDCLDTMCE